MALIDPPQWMHHDFCRWSTKSLICFMRRIIADSVAHCAAPKTSEQKERAAY